MSRFQARDPVTRATRVTFSIDLPATSVMAERVMTWIDFGYELWWHPDPMAGRFKIIGNAPMTDWKALARLGKRDDDVYGAFVYDAPISKAWRVVRPVDFGDMLTYPRLATREDLLALIATVRRFPGTITQDIRVPGDPHDCDIWPGRVLRSGLAVFYIPQTANSANALRQHLSRRQLAKCARTHLAEAQRYDLYHNHLAVRGIVPDRRASGQSRPSETGSRVRGLSVASVTARA